MGWFKKKARVQVEDTCTGTTKLSLAPFDYCGVFPGSQSTTRWFVVSGAELFVDEMPFSEKFTVEIPVTEHQSFQQLANNKASTTVTTAEAVPVLQMFRDANTTNGAVRSAIHALAIGQLLVLFAPFLEQQAREEAEAAATKTIRDAALKEKYALA